MALLLDLYEDQSASANGSRTFPIRRGVRQGDVLSSLLFNAVLETVFRRWKTKLSEHGWLIQPDHPRLTNTRYADDCLLYAKNLSELTAMLEHLHDELSAVGLEIHEHKTKILTSSDSCRAQSVQVRGMNFQILPAEQSHRYLGRQLCLDSSCRVGMEINSRLSAAWCKFNAHRQWLQNSHISLKLRMRFFEACVQPTALFALHVLPLRVADLSRIAATERRMKRCIVGWVRQADDDWPTTMRRMRYRVARADSVWPSRSWLETIWLQQWHFVAHLHDSACDWPRLLANWQPDGCRFQGRPHLRWDDHINRFCRQKFQCDNWSHISSAHLLRYAGEFSASAPCT